VRIALFNRIASSEPARVTGKIPEGNVKGELEKLLIANKGNALINELPALAPILKELSTKARFKEGRLPDIKEARGTIIEGASGAKELAEETVKGAVDKLDNAKGINEGKSEADVLERLYGKLTKDAEKVSPEVNEGTKLELKESDIS